MEGRKGGGVKRTEERRQEGRKTDEGWMEEGEEGSYGRKNTAGR